MMIPKPTKTPPRPPPISVDAQLCIDAHVHASRNREETEASARCACYFCFKTFPTATIKAWIDANQTALCPFCGVDSVLGNASQIRIDDRFLRQMHQHHFAYRAR